MKTLILFTTIFLIFVGNVGLPVFNHSCKENGVFTSYIFNHNACVCANEKVPPCCEKDKDKEDGCCSDSLDVLKNNCDYERTANYKLALFALLSDNNTVNTIQDRVLIPQIENSVDFEQPPNKPPGKLILLKKQVFQI